MGESYRALCSDFYVNLKLSLKLDLPRERGIVLDMFDRVRRQYPSMRMFRRYKDELALESSQGEPPYRWLAIRSNTIRAGVVNPEALEEAYSVHRHVLEVAPFFLSISPLDVDSMELLYGLDLAASGNHDRIVYEALMADTPMGRLLEGHGAEPLDCQPILGVLLGAGGVGGGSGEGGEDEMEAHFEVKTRATSRERRPGEGSAEPISIYLTLRKHGPVGEVKDLSEVHARLASRGEELLSSRVVPHLLMPIRETLGAGPG